MPPGAMVFNIFVGQVMAALDPALAFFALAALHPIAAVVLCSLVLRKTPPVA